MGFEFYHNNEMNVFSDLIPRDSQFLEFGVCTGGSANLMLKDLKQANFTAYFGFDSFIGLPAPRNEWISPDWHEGSFNSVEHFQTNSVEEVKQVIHGIIDHHNVPVTLIDGWYSDTLNKETITKFGINKAGYVNIDVDYYSSTVEVLDFLVQNDLLMEKAVIRYDDWLSGPEWQTCNSKAHLEKTHEYGILFNRIGTNVFQYMGKTKDFSFGNLIT